jgi:DeoR family fructose operon transcriptional repressor
MAQAATRVVVLADSSKVGAELLIGFAALGQVDVLITDEGLTEPDRAELVKAGLEVVVA